uniref:DnaJ homolog subfamily C member 21-like n=1 Tax=Petromyzon marinus TaxID=7757 RepID=A0AAJ7SX22_PETMA|nr:dnaJ homolog subfamily C member 21-like [Petromyzon marinus]
MSLTRQEAYAVLGLPNGASEAEIKSAYKKLALEWHPDKNNNSETATIKFQQVTGAYQLLTAERNEAHMSLDEMLDLFNMMFFGAGGGFPFYRPRFVFINGDRDEFYSSDDSDMEYLFNPSRGFHETNAYPRQSGRESYHRTHASSTTSTAHMGRSTYNTITVEEANKNAADLIQEEQNAKKKTEKRKSKKKRRKERKQQERVEKDRHKNPEDKEDACLGNSSENDEETEVTAESKTVNKEPIVKPGPLPMESKKGAGAADALKGRTVTKDSNKENTSPPVFSGTKDNAGAASYSETHDNKSVNVEVKSNGHAKQAKARDAPSQREPVHSYTLPASEKIGGNSSVNGATKESSDSEDEPEWDTCSAFFAKVASKQQPKHTKVDKKVKSKEKPVPVKEEKPTKVPASVVPQKPSPDELAQRSVQFAVQGNQLASTQSYAEAIEKFTEAIKLYPQDFRYFGNRSYCFERLGKYNDALMDAEIAVNINPIWPRGYFRKARACIGLKHYREAESALCQVISLDMSSEDAKQELMNVRTLRLMEMGFPQQQSEAAIWEYDTVDAALEALLRKTGALPKSGVGNMGIQNHKLPSTRPNVAVQRTQDLSGALGNSSVPPPPPYNLISLWVGNLTSAVTEDMLQTLFSPFGQIHSFRMLLDRKCAFVNYTTKEAADRALWSLQGYQVANTNLLIRFQSASTKSVAAAFQQPQAVPPPPASKNGFSKMQSKNGFH